MASQYANRGKSLETLVERSARAQGLHIEKNSPRSVATGKRDLQGRMLNITIASGKLDFHGHWRTKYFTFDAKSCAAGTRFPLADIAKHQEVICRHRHAEGVVAFFLVEFTQPGQPQYFALTHPILKPYWDARMAWGEPASIPRAAIERYCPRVALTPRGLDLVGIIEQLQRGPRA